MFRPLSHRSDPGAQTISPSQSWERKSCKERIPIDNIMFFDYLRSNKLQTIILRQDTYEQDYSESGLMSFSMRRPS